MVRRGVLIVDHQNLIGKLKNLGLEDFEPDWLVNSSLRIADCEAFVLVTDLTVVNPVTNVQYLYEAERWSKSGFQILHTPSRFIRLSGDNGEPPATETNGNRYKRKDMSDGGIHAEIRRWCQIPSLTDILLFTHDVDFAQDLLWATTGMGKRTALLHMGIDNVAVSLRKAADSQLNVLEPMAAYSVKALDCQRFWHPRQDIETLGQMVWKSIAEPNEQTQSLSLLRRLADAQDLIKYVALDLTCVSTKTIAGAQRMPWGTLHHALLDYLGQARFGTSVYKQMCRMNLPSVALQAFTSGIGKIMEIWRDTSVLISDPVEAPTPHREFYLNLDHPAVTLLMETDFL